MLYKILIGMAFATAAVASPLTVEPPSPTIDIDIQFTSTPCDGGRVFVGWVDKTLGMIPQCKCLNGLIFDEDRGLCISPPFIPPVLSAGQKTIYKGNDLCLNNARNVVLNVLSSSSESQVKQQIREKCKKKPKCPAGQTWSEKDKKCKHPCLPKEDAQKCKRGGGKPVCAKDPKNYCDYNENNDLCEDNGQNILECLVPGLDGIIGPVTTLLDGIFATAGEALNLLGPNCVLSGLACVLTDTVWDKLLQGGGLQGIICGIPILGGILGNC
ncbi:hypothetical protein ACHAQH_003994 [Verticillium albo-atrum]